MKKYQFSGQLSPRPHGTEHAMCGLSGDVYLASEVDYELSRLNRVVAYLSDCHVATAEGVMHRKSSPKCERSRSMAIVEACLRYMKGGDPGMLGRSPEPVIERLERALATSERKS